MLVVDMDGLTDNDRALWKSFTKDVRRLDQAPVSPIEGLPRMRAPEPRAVVYDPRLDLHGAKIHEAYQLVRQHIANGKAEGYKKLLVITGRSGEINVELPRWLENHPLVRSIEQMSNGGSWQINLKRAT